MTVAVTVVVPVFEPPVITPFASTFATSLSPLTYSTAAPERTFPSSSLTVGTMVAFLPVSRETLAGATVMESAGVSVRVTLEM